MRKSDLSRIICPFGFLFILMTLGADQPRAQNEPRGRLVEVTGEVLALPEGAPLPEALRQSGPLTYSAIEAMENLADSRVRILARPDFQVGDGDLGRYSLSASEGDSARERPLPFLRLEVQPAVRGGGRVAMSVRLETEDAGGVADRVAATRVFNANSGVYEIFGPLRLEGRRIFVLLRVGMS